MDEQWDFWDECGMHCAGYNSEIDRDLILVFMQSDSRVEGRSVYSSDVASRLGLAEAYVELLKYALCSANFCEYGSSPRGAWVTHGKQDELREKLFRWYGAKWGESPLA
jgi:hypothetical protein